MRKATFAKLSLTAAVGIGTLFGFQGAAQADDMKFTPAPPSTIKPLVAVPVDPDPDPPFDPELPIVIDQPEDDECDFPCDKAPVPLPDPEPECQPHMLCSDQVLTDAGCKWTHGCPEDPEPECPEIVVSCDVTSDPGCQVTHGDCGGGDEGTDGGDEGTDDGGDEGTDGGDEGTDDGGDDCDDAFAPEAPAEACVETTDGETTDGGTGGGTLPRTGAEMATWVVAGLGLTGVGAALKKLGKRAE